MACASHAAVPVVSGPRRRLQAAELRLRHARTYQRVRRGVLGLSLALTILGPLAHLVYLDGARAHGLWADLARALPASLFDPGAVWLGAPWTVRLLGLEILDPVAALSVLVAAGPSRALLLGALPAVVLVVLLGRFFCGWLCPYVVLVAVGNTVRALLAKLGYSPADRVLPRHTALVLLAAVVVLGLLTGTPLAQLYYPPAVVAREVPRALYAGVPTVGVLSLGLALGFDVLVSRAGFCKYLCPGGAVFRLLGRRSRVRIQRDAAKCTDCTACDAVCNLGQSPMTDQLDAGCERCAKCVSVCPTRALRVGVDAPAPVGHPRLPVVQGGGRR